MRHLAGLAIVLAAVGQCLSSDQGTSPNIRHGRSRIHLVRPEHHADDPSERSRGDTSTTRVIRSDTGSTISIIDLSVTDNILQSQLLDDQWHPKDDAEDIESSMAPDPVDPRSGMTDIVTRFLRIVESQQHLGDNCTAGTDLNLGEGVVDRYAQVCFHSICY